MERLRIEVNASMVIIAGDEDAELPPDPDDTDDANGAGPSAVVAGPEAIFVSGRVQYDAPTLIRVGDRDEAADLTLAYTGNLATPDGRLQILNMDFDVLGEVGVPAGPTSLSIYLSDLVEPDEILVVVQ